MAAPKGNQYAAKNRGKPPTIYDNDYIENEAEALLEWVAKGDGLYIDSFVKDKPYSRQRLWEWTKSNKVMSDAMEKAKEWQERKFIEKGLNREWDSGFTKYVMARVCGDKWKASYEQPDTQTVEHIGTVTINKISK